MIKKIFLVHHTHTDIGYTDIQTKVFEDHIKFLDQVLDYCRKTDEYPETSKFRWTCEVGWQVNHYFKNRPEKIRKFIERVKEGRIEITGLYLNLTDLFSLEMLIRSFYFLRELKEKYGISVDTAMNCDINGLSWNLPQILQKCGMKYLLMATNEIRGFAPGIPMPFYWSSPDVSRVLVWNAGRKSWYAEGLVLGFGESYRKIAETLPEHLKEIERDYPYDAICLQAAMDNQPPTTKVCEVVKKWNEKGKMPEIILSTPTRFFRYIEKKYASKFPECKLAWPDWWADGNGSCALESSLCLNNSRKIIENEAIYSVLNLVKGTQYPFEKINEIWDSLFFFAEHTFGASGSISEPFSSQTLGQWAIKSGCIYQAAIENQRVNDEGIEVLKKEFPEFNKDEPAELQKITGVPVIENEFYKIGIDEITGGIKSIYDKETEEEIVDKSSPYKSNQYLYENIASPEGRDAIWDANSKQDLWSPEKKRTDAEFRRYEPRLESLETFKDKDSKKIVRAISGKGCREIISEIRLPGSSKRIEITNTLRKEGGLQPEGVYFVFPFNFRKPKVEISGPGKAVFEPEKEQMPSTARDYYSVEDWLILSDEMKSIVWVSPDAPLIQISEINTGKWLKELKIGTGTIFSYAMNNYWYTNFRAGQSEAVTFRYLITSQKGKPKNSYAHNFSQKFTRPVFSRLMEHLFKINKKNLSVFSFKKAEDKNGFILRIKEMDGIKTVFNLNLPRFKNPTIFLSDPLERKIKRLSGRYGLSFEVKPFEMVAFYLQIGRT